MTPSHYDFLNSEQRCASGAAPSHRLEAQHYLDSDVSVAVVLARYLRTRYTVSRTDTRLMTDDTIRGHPLPFNSSWTVA